MKRVCIVTPGALGSNPRVVKEAQALYEVGYEVVVISTRTSSEVDRLDNDILSKIQWRAIRLDLRQKFYWRLSRVLQVTSASCYTFFRHHLCATYGFSNFARLLIGAAKSIKADLYIAHYPAALPAAAKAAKKYSSAYAFDAEDYHLGDLVEGPEHELERSMIKTLEQHYLSAAYYVTAASQGIADAYVKAYGISRPKVVLNVFPLSHAPLEAVASGTASPGPSVYWFSQTIGPGRGLECAVRAIGKARSRPHLYLRGTPATDFVEELSRIASEVGVIDNLHILPPELPSEMEKLAATHDVGFVGETGYTDSRCIALTNKQFTYLLAGIPVIMSDIPAHRDFAEGLFPAVRLYTVNDPCTLAKTLDDLLLNTEQLEESRRSAFELGQTKFNWEREQGEIISLAKTAMSDHL